MSAIRIGDIMHTGYVDHAMTRPVEDSTRSLARNMRRSLMVPPEDTSGIVPEARRPVHRVSERGETTTVADTFLTYDPTSFRSPTPSRIY